MQLPILANSKILDIDEPTNRVDTYFLRDVISFIDNDCKPFGLKFLGRIPSKNGYHLITKPFDLQVFSKEFPTVEVHKNNPTNLYIP